MVNHFKQTEMKTLEKTMVQFVLETHPQDLNPKVYSYADFLSTTLTLGMFICVDDDGNILEEPKNVNYQTAKMFDIAAKRYQKALSNVLFEGFHLQHHTSTFKTVSNGGIQITLDQYGLYLEPHDSVDGERIEVIESLIPYKLKLTDNFKL